ncbi:MAG TPA: tRNA pseudouridine(55) synthase TruB [Geminicoccaceae bacterium]|jgi:tRNA pseudouridine55 synthase|nr:tRNA pseudouridine(55) synthase TruB [Geminicoccaceae bacterium]
MARPKGLPIHGWLCLDKPAGMTSTGAVSRVRRITHARKVGHGGTLDPLATGVLPIAMGEATKTVAYAMEGRKHYRFTARLGEARTTDDAEGEVVATSDWRPTSAEIEAALPSFVGLIEQVPPSFAAIKVEGERAYDLARRGEAVQLPPRNVRVDRFDLIERPDPDHATFELLCGRGTYVRALVRDLGAKLGCLGHVVALRRLRVGPFREEDAVSLGALEQLVADDALPQALLPVGTALGDLPALALTQPQVDRLCAGQTIRVAPGLLAGEPDADATVRAMAAGRMVALARLHGGELTPVRVFNL